MRSLLIQSLSEMAESFAPLGPKITESFFYAPIKSQKLARVHDTGKKNGRATTHGSTDLGECLDGSEICVPGKLPGLDSILHSMITQKPCFIQIRRKVEPSNLVCEESLSSLSLLQLYRRNMNRFITNYITSN